MHEHIRSSKCPNYDSNHLNLKARQGFTVGWKLIPLVKNTIQIQLWIIIFLTNRMAKTIPVKYDIDIINKLSTGKTGENRRIQR